MTAGTPHAGDVLGIDDHSRLAYAEILTDERKETASAFMARAIGFFSDHGVRVERVLTDSGACYRSRDFARVLAEAEIGHRRTRPYRPQTNGKVERFNLTLKWEWAYAQPYETNTSRTDALERWLHDYNYHRPHMAHAGRPRISVVNNVEEAQLGVELAAERRRLGLTDGPGFLKDRGDLRVGDEVLPALLIPVEERPNPVVLIGIAKDGRTLGSVLLSLLSAFG